MEKWLEITKQPLIMKFKIVWSVYYDMSMVLELVVEPWNPLETYAVVKNWNII